MAVRIAPVARQQFFDALGAELAGGFLYTYAAGSTTPLPTFTDSTGGTANTNPLTLNSRGETPYGMWLIEGIAYKFVLKDSGGSTIWSEDNIRGVNDASVAVDQWNASGFTPTYISATSFSVPGDQTSILEPKRRIKATTSGGTRYGMILTSSFSAGITTVTVSLDSGSLDSGLSAVSYGLLSASNSSIPGGRSTWTPVITAASVNPVVGNGAVTGDYKLVAGMCFGSVLFTFGSTTTAGTGAYTITLPFTAAVLTTRVNARVEIFDSSTGIYYIGSTNFGSGATSFQMQTHANAGDVSGTSPVALTTGDSISVTFAYPVA